MKRSFLAALCCPFLALLWLGASTRTTNPVAPIPVFRKDARILFQGDSITDGNRGRSADPNHVMGHGYAYSIASRFGAAFPESNLAFMNRGVSGNKVSDLAARWQRDTIDLKPDILSILIGVNDQGAGVPVEQFERDYDKLLADTRAALPGIRLVLCEPFSLPVGGVKEHPERWVDGLRTRREAVARLATKHHAALVRLQAVFDAACKRAPADYWIWDGIHPTYSGHQLIADEWERVVRGLAKP